MKPERAIEDESIVVGILSGLRFLARHARDRAAAGGDARVRVQLYPVSASAPFRIGHGRGFMSTGGKIGEIGRAHV